MTPAIIFEDDSFLVIDKPGGMVVNRSESQKQETLEDWAIDQFIVHRLDKDTSGLLLIAKTQASLENLQAQFKSRHVTKKYLTLVHGIVEPKEGVINVPIARSPFNRMHFGIFPGGREAETKYKMLKQVQHDKNIYSLLEVTPKTGRTHQIRVHLKYLGSPVVSDPIYGGRKNLQADLKFCPRLFLHAAEIKFSHPVSGIPLEFKTPLPLELKNVLEYLCGAAVVSF